MVNNNEQAQKFEFKAETQKVLDILIHSLYTNKDIFLRELISNASDALDKVRFLSIKGDEIVDNDLPYEIHLKADKEKNILIVADNGIGMTKDEAIKNLGTIAKSGTEEFIKNLPKDRKEVESLIGRFGVGFYSVFMVADEVEIITKSAIPGNKPVKWISDGKNSYEVYEIDEDQNITRGTKIHIYLKDDAKEYTEPSKLKEIINTHSSFISFPIFVEGERVNTLAAIWREPKNTLRKEQYEDFYKFLTHDYQEPLDYIHISIDAPIQYKALLFIPKSAYDFYGILKEDYGLDLYSNRVLIKHKFKDLLPEYLGFLQGVVDSEDLPLNVSRESIQENAILRKISSNLVSQVFSHLQKLATERPDDYKLFWKEHAKVFKHGYSDFSNKDKFIELIRFNSSTCQNQDEIISLNDYVSRMKPEQEEIYYSLGNSYNSIKNNPHFEIFERKGLEVLFLYDPFDEFMLSALANYKDKKFVLIENADIQKINKMPDEVTKDKDVENLTDDEAVKFGEFLVYIKKYLGDKVKEVKESNRLLTSPACLVDSDGMFSSSFQKIIKMMNKDTSIPPKVFEINKDHKIIRNLLQIFTKDKEDEFLKRSIDELFDTALLLDGYLNDPTTFASHINYILEKSTALYNEKK
ncbi:MAG TPA: molecular chaperone HtpG [Ignavibacteriales bacterium]|nr:molecular chaperone HtpG [Ignavibacteriales bacterium]